MRNHDISSGRELKNMLKPGQLSSYSHVKPKKPQRPEKIHWMTLMRCLWKVIYSHSACLFDCSSYIVLQSKLKILKLKVKYCKTMVALSKAMPSCSKNTSRLCLFPSPLQQLYFFHLRKGVVNKAPGHLHLCLNSWNSCKTSLTWLFRGQTRNHSCFWWTVLINIEDLGCTIVFM